MKSQNQLFAAALLMMLAILLFSRPVLAESGTHDVATQQVTSPQTQTGTYAVGWGTLTLINAGLAQGKNRKGLNWFLISLLLGPIATLLLVAFIENAIIQSC